MKIAILSDIHGNMAALHAVDADVACWRPDHVVVNGDTVNRGPETFAAWQFVRDKGQRLGWLLLRGNHEGYIISREWQRSSHSMLDQELLRLSQWSYEQHQGRVDELAAMPDGCSLYGPDGSEVRVRHASMLSDCDGIYADTPAAQVFAQISPAPAVFITGHTHRPFIRQIRCTQVVNGGAVGVPLDGDMRASYIQLLWANGVWQAQIRRVAYDRRATRQAFTASGFLQDSGVISWLMFYEWERARPLLPDWFVQYETALRGGKLAAETAVRRYLAEKHLPVPR